MSDTPFTTPPVSAPQPATEPPHVNGRQPVDPAVPAGEKPAHDDLLREVTLAVRTLEDVAVRLATIEAELLALTAALALAAILIWKTRQA